LAARFRVTNFARSHPWPTNAVFLLRHDAARANSSISDLIVCLISPFVQCGAGESIGTRNGMRMTVIGNRGVGEECEARPQDGSLSAKLVQAGDMPRSIACENDGIYTSFKMNKAGKTVLLQAK
jgi:hypothetical protein